MPTPNDRRGIFSLQDFYEEHVSGSWTSPSEIVFTGSPRYGFQNVGYVHGGHPSFYGDSSSDRIDFSSDTTTTTQIAGTFPNNSGTRYMGSASNSQYTYMAGGYYPSSNRIRKFDFSNTTTTETLGATLPNIPSPSSYHMYGCGNETNAYFMGATNNYSYINRVTYSNDTVTSVHGLPYTTRYGAAVGNQDQGYQVGGYTETRVSRIDYSNDGSAPTPKGGIINARHYADAAGNANFGYIAGGYISAYTSIIERIDYSNDTDNVAHKGQLTGPRGLIVAFGNPSYGFFCGGNTPSSVSYVDRIDYSNDTTTASPKTNLSRERGDKPGGGSARDYANTNPSIVASDTQTNQRIDLLGNVETLHCGYWIGGDSNAGSTVERINFRNDTVNAVSKGNLNVNRYDLSSGGCGNVTQGYVAGGGPGPKSSIEKIDYSNDTAQASPKGNLNEIMDELAAVSNASYGYFGLGYSKTNIYRLDFANDTSGTGAARFQTTLPAPSCDDTTGYSNQSYGYIVGQSYSYIRRIDYANDTTDIGSHANLPNPSGAADSSACGNADYGWILNYSSSKMIKTDYANDTASPVVKISSITNRHRYGAAASDESFGYWAGGSYPDSTSVDRLDFSNDTIFTPAKGNLLQNRGDTSATGPRINGLTTANGLINVPDFPPANITEQNFPRAGMVYLAGTGSPGNTNLSGALQRFSMDNDSVSLSARAAFFTDSSMSPFTYLNGGGATASDTNYGYCLGIGPDSSSGSTTTLRLDYSNDTAAGLRKGDLVHAKYRSQGGYGNSTKGYTAGGFFQPGPQYSNTSECIEFANDTATASPKGNLITNRYSHFSIGNQTQGYVLGGLNPSQSPPFYTTTVERIDYSNDTAQYTPKGFQTNVYLPDGRRYAGASVGNANYGWFMGGYWLPYKQIDRLDYSNDTQNTSVRGGVDAMPDERAYVAGGGNDNYGYAISGFSPGGDHTNIYRLDYANDTAGASTRGSLPTAIATGYGMNSARQGQAG